MCLWELQILRDEDSAPLSALISQFTICIPSSSITSLAYVSPLAHLQGPINSRLVLESTSAYNFNFQDITNLVCDQQPHKNPKPLTPSQKCSVNLEAS